MRLLQSAFLNDGKNFNFGQPATLIELESPADSQALLENIVNTRYYDSKYFEVHSGYRDGQMVPNFWFIAEIARALSPRSVFEVGCGRGDALRLLARSGIDVSGVDFSADAVSAAWPEIKNRIELGDLHQVAQDRARRGATCDLLLGFDIWEHLLPTQLEGAIASAVSTLTDDGFGFFIVPAFGNDPVFGEPFPIEFELNRPEFERHLPFRFLLAEKTDPAIPASGHLVWADTVFWEACFSKAGLVRMKSVEHELHRYFDHLLPRSNRCFYLFRRDTAAAAERERRIIGHYSWVKLARCVAEFVHATTVKKEVRGGLIRHVVAQRTPERLKSVYRSARSLLRARRAS